MKNALLLVASLVVSLFVFEGTLRLIFDEVDYLRTDVVAHPRLGHVIAPGSGGHDRWGFRNKQVPEQAAIIALGDSMTYGDSTPARDAYPLQLGRMLDKSVYNMGVGGYGPPQYEYVLDERALSLSPDVILIGFYFGNDLPSSYRQAVGAPNKVVDVDQVADNRFLPEIRNWLSHNSMLYQFVKHNGGAVVRNLAYHEAAARGGPNGYVYADETRRTVFNSSKTYFAALDQSDRKNQIGLAYTIDVLSRINDTCLKNAIRCLIVLLPTKASVYWPYAKNKLTGRARDDVATLVRAEATVRTALTAALMQRNLEYVDPMDDMRGAAGHEPLYHANGNNHPNSNGHRVIAAVIAKRLVVAR